jgi:hypothetical protein
MISDRSLRVLLAAGFAGTATLLAGCSSTTYGTGTSPGVQTIEDLAGIVALSSKEKEPVDYKPRPAVVAPPDSASLPVPGEQPPAQTAANWPKDPDAMRREIKERQRQESAEVGPGLGQEMQDRGAKFKLPTASGAKQGDRPWYENRFEQGYHGPVSDADATKASKLFADARKSKTGSVDENGAPVRRYLTEPPAEYREPDPTAPTEVDAKEKPTKKKKWSLWPF